MAESQTNDQQGRAGTPKSALWGLVPLLTIIGLLIAISLPWLQSLRRDSEAHRGVGEKVTYLELEPLTGDQERLSAADLEGRVTLLNFWGPWCPPCRGELPHMADLKRQFAGQAFQLVAISYPAGPNGDMESLRKDTVEVLDRLNVDLPTYHDLANKTADAMDRLIGLEGYPTNVLLDRHGVIRAVWVGYQSGMEHEIESRVRELINETAAPAKKA